MPVGSGSCSECPFDYQRKKRLTSTDKSCTTLMFDYALDLINRQQAENKELKTENLILSQKRFNIFERIEFTDKLKKQAKSEAIKEFAGKIADVFCSHDKGDTYVREIVYNLVKEMAGEDK
jgi:hypothetical protein